MITDGYNVTYMKFGQFKNGLLFQIRIDGNSALLEIDADHFIKTNLSLAVETFRDENRSSSESLKHLIVRTSGKIIARNLTEPGRLQLEAFKKRQRGGKSLLKRRFQNLNLSYLTIHLALEQRNGISKWFTKDRIWKAKLVVFTV